MIDQEELKHLLLTAINAAIKAGALIMDVYNSDNFQVSLKSDATPLTLADRESNNEIVNALMKTRIPVMSEEGRNLLYEERQGWEYFWLVDPLDGTKEFIKRNGEFTVNIALVYNNYPIAGVVYIPVHEQLYFSLENMGAYRIDSINTMIENTAVLDSYIKESNKLPLSPPPEAFTIAVSRSHPSDETQNYINSMMAKHENVTIIARGSSLKICMVAEGGAHIYPRFGKTTEWDTAAAQAIAESAGCEVLSLEDNKRLRYNKEDINNPWFIVKHAEK
ncbi:MAG: 3'(2'),5'-bisphosphate nucleotidase CysQ [Bacteroidales bacterium]